MGRTGVCVFVGLGTRKLVLKKKPATRTSDQKEKTPKRVRQLADTSQT